MEVPQKTKLPYDPVIPFPGIYLEKTIIRKDTCIAMLTAALQGPWPGNTPKWPGNTPKCPSTDGWIKRWYMYTMKCYSALTKNEIMPSAATWMNLEIIILSKVNQRKTNTIWHHLYVEATIWYKWTYLKNKNSQMKRTDLRLPGVGVAGREGLQVWD